VHAAEYALEAGRPVVVIEPRGGHWDVVEAFEHFRRLGALTTRNVDEALVAALMW
jgi:hypothetical protein